LVEWGGSGGYSYAIGVLICNLKRATGTHPQV
jgi:hypothetical protein